MVKVTGEIVGFEGRSVRTGGGFPVRCKGKERMWLLTTLLWAMWPDVTQDEKWDKECVFDFGY